MNLIDCKGDLRIACYKSRRKTISYFGEEKQRESGVGNTGVEPVLVCICAQSWEGTGESPIIVIFTGNPVPAAQKINSAVLRQPGSAPAQGSVRAAPSLHTGRVFRPGLFPSKPRILYVLCAPLCMSLFAPVCFSPRHALFQKSTNNIKSENKSKLSEIEDLLRYYAHNP